MDKSIHHSETIFKILQKINLTEKLSEVYLSHIITIMIAIFSIGYHGKTVDFGFLLLLPILLPVPARNLLTFQRAVTETSLSVKGHISLPSLSLKTSVEGVGRHIDLTAQVWKRDFDKDQFTHLDYSGTRYRIDNISAGLNDLIVKLSLARN